MFSVLKLTNIDFKYLVIIFHFPSLLAEEGLSYDMFSIFKQIQIRWQWLLYSSSIIYESSHVSGLYSSLLTQYTKFQVLLVNFRWNQKLSQVLSENFNWCTELTLTFQWLQGKEANE